MTDHRSPDDRPEAGIWSRDLGSSWPGADNHTRPPDLAVLAATDALLDRIAARRPTGEDLDDPAAAVLALLATEVDLHPPAADTLRTDLFDRGLWPLVPAGSPPAAFLADTQVIDLRELVDLPAGWDADLTPEGGPAWDALAESAPPVRRLPGADGAGRALPLAVRGGLTEAPQAPAPRQVRIRLLAVAAVAAVALWGLSIGVTGAWSPWRAGQIIAGQDDGTQLEEMIADGLQLVSQQEYRKGKLRLEDAQERVQTADLTPEQRRKVTDLLEELKIQLESRGVVLPPTLQPTARTTPPAEAPSQGRAVVERSAPATVPPPVVVTPTPEPTEPTPTSTVEATEEPATDDPEETAEPCVVRTLDNGRVKTKGVCDS